MFDDPQYQVQNYVRLFGGEQLSRLEDRLTNLRRDLERAQNTLELSIADLQRANNEIQISQDNADQSPVDEFNRLLEHPNIERIEVTRDSINVFTDTIVIDHQDHRYVIGRFRIELRFQAYYAPTVAMINLDGRRGDYEHPHVHAGGSPCLGSISVALPEILKKKKYPAAIALCIQYLKTINTTEGSYLSFLKMWY
jgi:hypothetical protein